MPFIHIDRLLWREPGSLTGWLRYEAEHSVLAANATCVHANRHKLAKRKYPPPHASAGVSRTTDGRVDLELLFHCVSDTHHA